MSTSIRRASALAVALLATALLLLGPAARPAWADGGDLSFAGGKVQVYGLTSGSVTFDEATSTLGLDGATASRIWLYDTPPALTVELVGESALAEDAALGAATTDITVTGDGSLSSGIFARNLSIASGTVLGSVSCSGDFTMTGGSVVGNVWCEGNFSMTDGTVKATSGDFGVACATFDMSGGTVVVDGSTGLGVSVRGKKDAKDNMAPYTATMSGGTIRISSTRDPGIGFGGIATFNITGGTVEITNCSCGIAILGYAERRTDKARGGFLNITGGSVTALSSDTGERGLEARHMTNKLGCIKKVSGFLPEGGTFEVGGNVYASLGDGTGSAKYPTSATLTKYGSKSKNPRFGTVKYCGAMYSVEGVGSKAFSTKRGAKVKSIYFKDFDYCAPEAFAGTKSLTKLELAEPSLADIRDAKGRVKYYMWPANRVHCLVVVRVEKGAFSKCGKNGGKGLTVVLHDYYDSASPSMFRKAFTSRGMNKEFKLKLKTVK